MPDDARAKLAEDQARLVAALARRGDVPTGFDPARIDLSARTLLAKRRKGVRRAFPALAKSLAETFNAHFAAFARESPAHPDGPGADGLAFARWLDARGQLPHEADAEFVAAGLWRGPRLGVSLRRTTGRWLVGVRLPGVGVRLFRLPALRSARFAR